MGRIDMGAKRSIPGKTRVSAFISRDLSERVTLIARLKNKSAVLVKSSLVTEAFEKYAKENLDELLNIRASENNRSGSGFTSVVNKIAKEGDDAC